MNKDFATTYSQYKVEGKALQLKWTDLEIRKFKKEQAKTVLVETNTHIEPELVYHKEEVKEPEVRQTKSNLISYDSDEDDLDQMQPTAQTSNIDFEELD